MLDLPAHLRLALALAHSLPGGVLRLRTTDGGELRAAAESNADITPCPLRAAVLSRACPLWPGIASRISDIAVDGDDLTDLGGGLYRRDEPSGPSQRWFATLLAPGTVRRILEECPVDFPVQLDASLRPDVELGVVVAVLSSAADDVGHDAVLDNAARRASAACFTQELLYAALHPSWTQ